MKKTSSVFNIIAIYYALAYVFYFWRIESFIKDILIAPLFFLVPTGIGLLFFSIFGTHKKLLKSITGMQLILSSTFLGFLIISLSYTELNNNDTLPNIFYLVYPFFYLFSLVGFYHTKEILRVNDTFMSVLRTFALLSPLFLSVYYFLFIHFSPFPLRDIFMEVHFMKGALEFSKYRILNIATGDTYFALLQVHSGLLHQFFDYNLINSQWILPAYLFLLYFVCFYCFYSSFIKDRFILIVALGLNTIFTSLMFSNSNNSYLIMLTVVFFAVLVNKNMGRTKALPVFLELLGLCTLSIIFYLNRRIPSYIETMLPYLTSYIVFILLISYFNLNRLLPLAFVVLLQLIAPPYHRAASLYIPLTLVLYAIYFACFQWRLTDVPVLKRLLLKKVIIYSLICTPVGIGLGILVAEAWPSSFVYIRDFLNPISLAIVGQRISDNQGIVGTTAELVRFVPPSVYLLFLLLTIEIYKKRQTDACRIFIESNLNRIIFCVVSTLLLLVFFFSPLPNVHRVLVFPVLMLFLLAAFLIKFYHESYFKTKEYSRGMLLVPVSIIVYTLIARVIYDIPWKYPDITSPYVAELLPITEIGIVAMFLSLTALLLRRKVAQTSFFILVVLISGLMVDRFNMVTKLYGNAYGYDFPEPRVISHYTLLELKTAEELNKYIESPDNLMISDPYTLGIFEARTGINGFYTYANLGQFMLERYTNDIKAILRSVFPDIKDSRDMRLDNYKQKGTLFLHKSLPLEEDPLAETSGVRDYKTRNLNVMLMLAKFAEKNRGAVPEAGYTLQTKLRLPFETRVYRDNIHWAKEFKERIYWIINEKTVRWVYGDVGYYPMNRPFSRDYIKKYIRPYFDVVLNSENAVLVLKLK